jgi:hypothetical protein
MSIRRTQVWEDNMKRELISALLASLLWTQSGLCAKGKDRGAGTPPQANTAAGQTLKEQLLEIPPGTIVEVRLMNRERLRGRLGEASDEGFSLQTVRGNKIQTRNIAFDELKSVKKLEGSHTGKTAGYIILGGLAGIGVLFLVLLAAFARSGC